MIVRVKDVKGGKAFARRVADTAAEMAFCFSCEPDEKVTAALEKMRPALTRDFARIMKPDAAASIADAFIRAVITEKHRLEGVPAGLA